MRKLLTIIFCLLFAGSAFAAHPGPAQWSLAGVASWAQILTASGTAIPTATTTFTIGDFYAQNTDGSSTVTLYRLCASGTTSLWHPIGGAASEGGATSLIELTDFPATTGHDYEYLKHSTGGAFEWADPAAAITITAEAHIASSTDPHGSSQSIGGNYFTGYGNYSRRMEMNNDLTLAYGQIVIASYTEAFGDSYPALAPTSSTQAIGVFSYAELYGAATAAWVMMEGEAEVMVAVDSADIVPGDWVVTSDTVAGSVEKASVGGDLPLPFDEKQRALGICVITPYYDEATTATYAQIILKGLR